MKTENEFLSLEINENGGCLKSIYDKKREKELLYQPHPDSWKGQDVFIFPFIARLLDQTYFLDGKEYSMKNHGLLRYMKAELSLEKNKDIKASFESNEETLKQYPFHFRAYALYHLSKNKVEISYHIFNLSDRDMPFEVGAHPAFALPGTRKEDEFDISGNTVRLNKRMHLRRILQEETASYNIQEIAYRHTDSIHLSRELFHENPTLILKAEKFESVMLEKLDGSKLIIHTGKIPYLALWSDQAFGDYVAIEPWEGLPDYVNAPKDMYQKETIQILKPKKEHVFSYSIEIA